MKRNPKNTLLNLGLSHLLISIKKVYMRYQILGHNGLWMMMNMILDFHQMVLKEFFLLLNLIATRNKTNKKDGILMSEILPSF